MIFRIEDLKRVCTDILYAVDNQSTFDNENVEINLHDRVCSLSVTNSEYFVTVALPTDVDDTFNATVNASLFLKLISQISTDTVEITMGDTYITVTGNGEYKIPIIFNGDEMLHLRPIDIEDGETIKKVNVDGTILHSLLSYNMKELTKGVVSRPVQKLLYFDNNGAITFTSGACVNNFQINSEFAVLLTPKIVKLFKLFNADTTVEFTLGSVLGYGEQNILGVKFEAGGIKISAILPDSTMLSAVPVDKIRSLANDIQKFSVTINRKELSDALSRLILFADSSVSSFGKFSCCDDMINISLLNSSASEKVFYESPIENGCEYNMLLNLKDLKCTVDTYTDNFIVFQFGNGSSTTIVRGNVRNVIPECSEI